MEIWTGFIIGFFGSVHCIGMCGPIVLALPGAQSNRLFFITSRIFHSLGRSLTYALMGLVIGLIGQSIKVAGFQQGLSIVLGVMILLGVLLPSRFSSKLLNSPVVQKGIAKTRSWWASLFGHKSLVSLFVIGILNGFLPCGFVYVGLAGAASTGSAINGALFMALFGFGTTPALLATALAGKMIGIGFRSFVRKLLPAGAILLATLMILRGLSLGIPYISPDMEHSRAGSATELPECCE
ncbi:sulfite exporter TauE/SafE family protein [Calditrichota bacterium]